ncbi:MAG: metallophosphoesterase [Planctomycetes bacterium]|nr:metallophosphoesterase [Planctomycetota bacterium]MBI3847842.1 metallophosphoesterase [Planctomycetota bacterium]
MLVIISDLHITDETTAINVHPSAFQMLAAEIRSVVTNAEKNVRDVHVVLLGDIFDLVRTAYWNANQVALTSRPWGGKLDETTAMNPDPAVEGQFQAILSRILKTSSATALHDLLADLPNGNGQTRHVTYVIGNHDRVLNNFKSLKTQVEAWFPQVQFTNQLSANDYHVLACHGHEWDENCHGWEFSQRVLEAKPPFGRFAPDAYRVMAIGEVVTAELLSGFIHGVEKRLTPMGPKEKSLLRNLKDVNNVRPMTEVFRWLAWITRGEAPKYIKVIRESLLDALDGTLECTLAKKWDDMKPDLVVSGDLTDYLDKARSVVRNSPSLDGLGKLISDVEKIVVAVKTRLGVSTLDSLAEGALHDFEGQNVPGVDYGKVQYIVYGHTHEARHDVRRALPDGRLQMYINTGTFLPFVDQSLDGTSFWEAYRMTYVTFFKDDEDTKNRQGTGPTMDLWNGIKRKVYSE